MPARILHRTKSLVVASAKPLLVAAWTGAAVETGDVSACLVSLLAEAKRIERAVFLVIVHPSTPLPSDDTRATIQAEIRRLYPHLVAGATVINRSGFVGSAQRAVVSTMQLVSRTPHPEKTVSSAKEAGTFLATELARANGLPLKVEDVVETFDQLTREVWLPVPS